MGAARVDSMAYRFAWERFLVEECWSSMGHDLNNHLGAVRNAVFFLRRKVSTSALWEPGGQVERFFSLIDGEVDGVQSLMSEPAFLAHIYANTATSLQVRDVVEESVALVGSSEPTCNIQDGIIHADHAAVVVALVEVIKNGVESGGSVDVLGTGAELHYAIDIVSRGASVEPATALQPFHSDKAGHRGIGLKVARRAIRRQRGELEFRCDDDGSVRCALRLPTPTADVA